MGRNFDETRSAGPQPAHTIIKPTLGDCKQGRQIAKNRRRCAARNLSRSSANG